MRAAQARIVALSLAVVGACGGAAHQGVLRAGSADGLARRLEAAVHDDPRDLRARFLQAVFLDTHGKGREALRAWVALVDAAAASDDPLAPDAAEVAVHGIEDLEERATGWRDAVEALAARRLRDPGAIGPLARHGLAEVRSRLALRAGDRPEAERLESDVGCVSAYRVAGPFGPRELLHFERAVPPEAAGALAATYDLGAGRGLSRVRSLSASACVANLGGELPLGGSTAAVAWATVPRAVRATLRVESPNSVRVSVNGVRVLEVDARRRSIPRVHLVDVALPAGTSKVTTVVGSRHPNPVLLVSLMDARGAPIGRWSGEEPATHAASAQAFVRRAAAGSLDARVAAGEGLGDVERLLLALRGLGRGDATGARDVLGPGRAPLVDVVRGIVTLSDTALPDELRRERARQAFDRALRADVDLWQARIQLARLFSAEDRLDDALGALEEAERRAPTEPDTPLLLSDVLTLRGWHSEAEAALGRARAANPDACGPLAALYAAARRRGDVAAAEELARAHVACDARVATLLDAMRSAGRHADATTEARRLVGLDPRSAAGWEELSATLLAAGDREEAERALDRARALQPRDMALQRQALDLALAAGEPERALAGVARPIALAPGEAATLLRPRALVDGRRLLGAFRLDGREVIAAFEASGRRYDAPSVLVLDYTVIRILEDGSSLELTHNVVRVQSDEGVEQWGEWSAPEGADVLRVETVKADGTRLEPETVAGKTTLSLPNLAVGDYVEYEYVAVHGAPTGFPGGYFGDRFYFQSFEVPFDRTQLTIVAPKDCPLVVSRRGDAPVAQETDWEGLRIWRFRKDAVPPLTPEPRSVSNTEFLPSVHVSRAATWPSLVESLRDQLVDRARRNTEVDRLVGDLTKGADRRSERARRIWKWVLRHVDDEGDPFGQASHAVLSRSGSRVRALHAMLEAAGVPAELALARDVGADQTPDRVANADTYAHFLVRAETEAGVVWLAPWDRFVPFGYVPAAMRGQPVLRLDGDVSGAGATERLPAGDADADALSIEADAVVAPDGSGTVTVRETHSGAGAMRWRAFFSELPEADRAARFEQGYVGRLSEGANLSDLDVSNLDDPEKPLVLAYRFEAPHLARKGQRTLHLRPFYPLALAPEYAPLPVQRFPMGVTEQMDVALRVSVTLPEGAAADAPRPVQASHALGAFDARVRATGGAIELRRTFALRPGRVTPDDYPAFADFCRTVDRVELSEIRIDLGAARE